LNQFNRCAIGPVGTVQYLPPAGQQVRGGGGVEDVHGCAFLNVGERKLPLASMLRRTQFSQYEHTGKIVQVLLMSNNLLHFVCINIASSAMVNPVSEMRGPSDYRLQL
jgi:hypothetical protein